MKHINLDQEDERIKTFILSLPLEPGGSLLQLGGEPILRVLPPDMPPYDLGRLKDAILRRREESRAETAEWADVDQQAWDALE